MPILRLIKTDILLLFVWIVTYVCYNLVGCCIQFAMVLLLYQVETLALVQLLVELEKH